MPCRSGSPQGVFGDDGFCAEDAVAAEAIAIATSGFNRPLRNFTSAISRYRDSADPPTRKSFAFSTSPPRGGWWYWARPAEGQQSNITHIPLRFPASLERVLLDTDKIRGIVLGRRVRTF